MSNKKADIIRLIARIWGSIILSFVLFFVFAHIFGEEQSNEGFLNTKEILTFIFFPISTIIGLILAFKWEGLGGLIASLGLVAMFIIRIDLISSLIFIAVIFPPGILYLIYWFLSRRGKTSHNKTYK